MVFKRVKGWTSEGAFPYKILWSTPGSGQFWIRKRISRLNTKMELDYTWARVKFLHWPVERSSNTGNIFAKEHCQHCKLKSVVALISTFAPNLSRSKFQCCKLRQHIVAQSRPEFYFLQQTFNFIICVTTCYASQHLWLVTFPAPKVRERW